MKTIKLAWLSLILAIMGMAIVAPITVQAGQGFYIVDKSTRTGMLVSLTENPGVIEPATNKNDTSLLGIVGNSATDFDVQAGQVAVQTEGMVQTLVTTIDGDIVVGDRIAASSLVGLGSKRKNAGWVVGTAQASLSAATKGAIKTTVKDTNGSPHDVYVATIPVLVQVTYFDTSQPAESEKPNALPKSIQALADSIAGKRASVMAVVLAFLLLVIGLVIAGYIVNSAVRNGIQALGRQPLARQTIIRRMIQAFLIAAGLLISVVIGAFIVIRLF